MHQRERQGGVGAGAQGNVFMALVGGFRAARVDAHQPRAVALGLVGKTPEMQVAANRIAAPDQDQFGLGEMLHLHAHFGAKGVHQRLATGAGANRAFQLRSAQPVEKARGHAFALYLAHGARVAVGQDGFGVLGRNGFQAGGNRVECFFPADALKLPAAFGAYALQGMEDAFGVVGALGVARDFGAQRAIGVAVVRVALDADGHAVFDRGDQGTGVGAIVGAGAAHGGG